MALKEEFEKEFSRIVEWDGLPEFIDAYYDPKFLDSQIVAWIEHQIKQACDKQRKECVKQFRINSIKPNHNMAIAEHFTRTEQSILNAPYPEGVEK